MSCFPLLPMPLMIYTKYYRWIRDHKYFSLFNYKSFIVLNITLWVIFWSLSHSELNFVYTVRQEFIAILFHVDMQFFQHWKDAHFSIECWWPLGQNSHTLICEGLFGTSLLHSKIVSIFMLLPHCRNCYTFAISFETRNCECSSFNLSFLDVLAIQNPMKFSTKFKKDFYISGRKKIILRFQNIFH